MQTEAEKKAIEKYQKENIQRYTLKLNKRTDALKIAHIEKQGKFNTYVKRLIEEDMKKKQGTAIPYF